MNHDEEPEATVNGGREFCLSFRIWYLTNTSTYLGVSLIDLAQSPPAPLTAIDHLHVQPNENSIPQFSLMSAATMMGHGQALPLYTRALAIG